MTTPKRILIVDDDIAPALVLRSLVPEFYPNVQCTVVQSAERAEELLAEDVPFDLIITDRQMKGMSGILLMQRVRAGLTGAHPTIPMVLLTGDPEEIEGFSIVFAKPFDALTLLATIGTLLDLSSA